MGMGGGDEGLDDGYPQQGEGIAEEHILHHFRNDERYRPVYPLAFDENHEFLFELVGYDLQMKTEKDRIEYFEKALSNERTDANMRDGNKREVIWFALQFHNPRLLRF